MTKLLRDIHVGSRVSSFEMSERTSPVDYVWSVGWSFRPATAKCSPDQTSQGARVQKEGSVRKRNLQDGKFGESILKCLKYLELLVWRIEHFVLTSFRGHWFMDPAIRLNPLMNRPKNLHVPRRDRSCFMSFGSFESEI